MSEPNYYEILQVSPNAEPEVIQAAYRRLTLKYHPDRNHPDSERMMRLLNDAYAVLSDTNRRHTFDASLGKPQVDAATEQTRQHAPSTRSVMSVDTGKVQGRRELRFTTIDEILAEVERLNQAKVRAIGNWSPGQILKHVTVPMAWCLDGAPLKGAWCIRVFGWFMKNRFLRNPMPAGFKLSADFAGHLVPGETSWEDGLLLLRLIIARLKTEAQRHPSPFLGELTREQWDQLHCRHCELHLSFLIPE